MQKKKNRNVSHFLKVLGFMNYAGLPSRFSTATTKNSPCVPAIYALIKSSLPPSPNAKYLTQEPSHNKLPR